MLILLLFQLISSSFRIMFCCFFQKLFKWVQFKLMPFLLKFQSLLSSVKQSFRLFNSILKRLNWVFKQSHLSWIGFISTPCSKSVRRRKQRVHFCHERVWFLSPTRSNCIIPWFTFYVIWSQRTFLLLSTWWNILVQRKLRVFNKSLLNLLVFNNFVLRK